jgi:hypothetical protein
VCVFFVFGLFVLFCYVFCFLFCGFVPRQLQVSMITQLWMHTANHDLDAV